MNRRVLASVALVVLALVVALCLALLQRGRDAMAKSDAALERGDIVLAITFAERAALARLPGSPFPKRGYARLLELGSRYASNNEERWAKEAYGAALRAARTTGNEDLAEVATARAALIELDARRDPTGPSAKPPITTGDLAPRDHVRLLMASSVLVFAAGLVWLARGGRHAWAVTAVGFVGLVLAALQ